MDTNKIFEMLLYMLPALITGSVAYYFFKSFIGNEDKKRQFILRRANQKDTLPLRLQAYERMTLYLERISLNKLLLRITPISTDKNDYEHFLIAHIEQEFEHNLTQQIYISEDCWTIIITAKNTTIQLIKNLAKNDEVQNADDLRELILKSMGNKQSPSAAALSYIKNEVIAFL